MVCGVWCVVCGSNGVEADGLRLDEDLHVAESNQWQSISMHAGVPGLCTGLRYLIVILYINNLRHVAV